MRRLVGSALLFVVAACGERTEERSWHPKQVSQELLDHCENGMILFRAQDGEPCCFAYGKFFVQWGELMCPKLHRLEE